MELKTLLESLKKEIPYKWKIQTTPKWWKSQMDQDKKWQCVAYIDARDCMDILDSTCEWQDDYFLIRDTVFCKVGIKVWDEWIWRSDAGSKPDENSGEDAVIKWEASDAFKRACVKWWIGRFLYEKDFVWISYTDYNANKYKLTEFCNGNKKTPTSIPTKTTETPTGSKALRYFSVKDLERCIIEDNAFSKEAIKQWALDNWLTIWRPLQEVIVHYLEHGEIIQPKFD